MILMRNQVVEADHEPIECGVIAGSIPARPLRPTGTFQLRDFSQKSNVNVMESTQRLVQTWMVLGRDEEVKSLASGMFTT